MRKIRHLKGSWYFGAMAIAVILGEILRSLISRAFDLHISAIPVAAVSVGLVAVVVSLIYDGND